MGSSLTKKVKRHRLDITLEDIAKECHVSMNVIYSDIKRGKLDKNNLESIILYVNHKRQSVKLDNGLIL